MKHLIILLIACVFIGGCATAEQINDQRIKDFKKCTDAGMGSYVSDNGNLYCKVKN